MKQDSREEDSVPMVEEGPERVLQQRRLGGDVARIPHHGLKELGDHGAVRVLRQA
jgi:hypothetical protein